MNTLMKTCSAAVLTALLGFAGTASASTVDLFDDPLAFGVNTAISSGAAVHNGYIGGGILGGQRDLIAEVLSTAGGSSPIDGTKMEVGGGRLSFSNNVGVTGRGIVQWDGSDNSANLDVIGLREGGATGEDMINQIGCPVLGCDRFVAIVNRADFAFEYQIAVYTDAMNYSVLTANTQFVVPPGGDVEADYLFDWFNLANGDYLLGGLLFNIDRVGTVDFTNVGAMQLTLNSGAGQADVDLQLDSVTKRGLPEPGALALVGVGLLGAAVAGRRRKAVKA